MFKEFLFKFFLNNSWRNLRAFKSLILDLKLSNENFRLTNSNENISWNRQTNGQLNTEIQLKNVPKIKKTEHENFQAFKNFIHSESKFLISYFVHPQDKSYS